MKRTCIFCDKKFEDVRTTSSEYNTPYGICPICRTKMLKEMKKDEAR